uniref:Uncharacterized protein n=1 Tax=Aplanochytrium stocchinoi TaxID=215587 RepID=A0A7S3PEG9_9STRA|mmetsp:Transcript_11181/g.14554  ORF Transcript_11181/g.14554 Transcript_11181/m.14554 type:complete len:111 (-) Transcript_11181:14-346(-)
MDLCGTFAVPSSNKLGLKYGFLLSMLTLSTIGLLGDFLVVDTLGETKRWTLWNIWWADDAGKVLAKFGIDDMVNSLLITRTATILSLILSVVALILLTYKTLYSPRVASK